MKTVTPQKITIAMLICGVVSAAGLGVASAAAQDEDTLRMTVKYDPQNLATDSGARQLYHRLVNAAAKVCPADPSSPHLISKSVVECREQSVARAVHQINNPNLVAVYTASAKNG